jgi:hypothetical protein
MDYSEVKIRSHKGGYSVELPLRGVARWTSKTTQTVGHINLVDVLQLVCDEVGDRNRWEVKLVERQGH